jgi:hypothetical protein
MQKKGFSFRKGYILREPMEKVSFSRIMCINLKTHLHIKDFVLSVFTFSLIGLFSVYEVATYPSTLSKNVWDVLFVTFAGPSISDDSLFNLIFWFLPYLMFFYMFGNTAEEELSQRGVSIIPLIGSRRGWWLGEVATLFILSIIYVLIGIATVLAVSLLFLPWSNQISPFLLSIQLWHIKENTTIVTLVFGWILLLFLTTLISFSLTQMALSIMWRNSFVSLIFVGAVMVLSWVFGIHHPYIVRYLPGSQSMLLRHTFLDTMVYGFSLTWSLVYNAIIILIVLAVSFIYVRRMDIFKKISEIHKEA